MDEHKNNTSTKTQLSESERKILKRDFLAFADAHPAQEKSIPFWKNLLRPGAYLAAPAFAAAVLLVSESALPNEPLYAIKRNVTENVLLATTAFSPGTEAWADTQILERRLKEAEILTLVRKLDAQTSKLLSDDIDEHTEDLYEYTDAENSEGDTHEALEASSELENLFEAHASILNSLTNELNADLKTFIDNLEVRGDEASLLNQEFIDKIANGEETIRDEYIKTLQSAAGEGLENLHKIELELTNTENTKLTAYARDLRFEAQALTASSTREIESGDDHAALLSLQQAIENVAQAKIIFESIASSGKNGEE